MLILLPGDNMKYQRKTTRDFAQDTVQDTVQDSAQNSALSPHKCLKPSAVFVGHTLSFSDPMIRMACREFEDINIVRLESLQEVTSQPDLDPLTIRALVVEDSLYTDLVSDFEAFQKAAPKGRVVLAYTSPEPARKILAQQHQRHELAGISFLPMNVQFDMWCSIMRLTLCGEGYVPRDLLLEASLPHHHAPAYNTDIATLTQRENEVLSLVSEGKQNKVIAADLNLSEHTVKLHLHNIIGKLGVKNRTEATVWFLSHVTAAP
jgi:DNA-binding NarL/FixJ family response regulator